MIDDKESDERNHNGGNDEDISTHNIEVLKLGKLSYKRGIYNIEKYSGEINEIDMSDDKEYYERYQIGENDEDRSTDDIEVFKLGALISKRYIYNTEV